MGPIVTCLSRCTLVQLRYDRAMTPTLLVLFDIDGTILSTRGVAATAIRDALVEGFGTAGPVDSFPFMGKTDPQILRELLLAAGVAPARIAGGLDRAVNRYVELLGERLRHDHVCLCRGIRALLERLAADRGVLTALLTGNLERGAAVKLGAAGLAHLFAFGAYGSDHEDRNLLVPLARERARALTGCDFAGHATVVVGDAPPDVLCAHAGGARAVAVASGWTSVEELSRQRPHALLPDLGDTDAAQAVILGLADGISGSKD